ncbi:MAG: TusE/DsrC/DsvC family sulfur relay protein, partial [Gammaproteobacteria bacterium]|nr:TusE/DsrC/DsvC family sulfur relay protein [Gammaproteobacteria bacterium]
MQSLEVNSVGYELTTDGRLKNPEGWNEEVAEALANADGLVLTNEHWDVIQVMRKYYKEYNIPPIRKLLKKALAERYTHERAQDEYLQGLFPNDVLI